MNNPKIVIHKVNLTYLNLSTNVQSEPPKLEGFKFHEIASTHLDGKDLIITMVYLQEKG